MSGQFPKNVPWVQVLVLGDFPHFQDARGKSNVSPIGSGAGGGLPMPLWLPNKTCLTPSAMA